MSTRNVSSSPVHGGGGPRSGGGGGRNLVLATALAVFAVGPPAFAAEAPNLGKPISPQDIVPWDITIFPDGKGLPAGSGSPKQGEPIFAAKCCSTSSGAPCPTTRRIR
jgi:cytochrome c